MTSPNNCVINMSAAIHPPLAPRRFVLLLVLLLSALFYTHVAPLCDALPVPRIGGAAQNYGAPSDASASANDSPTTSDSNALADIMPMRLLFQTVHRVLNNLHSDGMVISTRLPVPSSEANRHLNWHSNPNPNPNSYSNSNSIPSRPDDHRPRGSKAGIQYHDVDVNFLDNSDGSVSQKNSNSKKKADISNFDTSTPNVAVSQNYKNRSFSLLPAWFNASDVTTRFVRGLNQSIAILTPLLGPTTNVVRSMSQKLSRAFKDSRRWLSARWSAYSNNYNYNNNIDSGKSKRMVNGRSMGTASLDRARKDDTVGSRRTGRNDNTTFDRGGTGTGELYRQRHGDNDGRPNSYYKDFSASSSSIEQERAAHSMISQSNTHPYSFAHPYPNKSGSGTTGNRSSNIYQHAGERQQQQQHQHVYGHSDSHKTSTFKTDGHVRIVSRNATAIIVRIDTDLPPFGSGRGSVLTSASTKHYGKHRNHHQHGNSEAHSQGSTTKSMTAATGTSSSSSSSSTADAKHRDKNGGGDRQQDEKGKPITNFSLVGTAEHKDNPEPAGDGGGGTGTGGVMQRRRADAATALVDADAVHDDDDMKSDVDVNADIDIDAYWEADSDSQDADDSELDMDVSMSLKTRPTLVVSANVMNNVVWVHVDHGNGLVAHHRIDLHPSKDNNNDIDNINRRKDDDQTHGHDDSVTAQHQQQFHEVIDSAHIVIESLDSKGYTLVIPRRVYANAVAAAGREEDDERFLSAQLECQRRFGSSGIRRMLCTCDELHAATMTTNKATTAPKTTPVSSPTTMSLQGSAKTFKSNVTSTDSKGSGGSSDSLTDTKKKNQGGSMKMNTTKKTAKTDNKLNNKRINSNSSPNSKSSSHSASTSSQQQKRQQKQPWEQEEQHQQLLQAIATNRRRLLCKARIADRVIRTAYRVGVPLVAASVRSRSVDCRLQHDPHHKHGHVHEHGLEEGDKTVLQAEHCLSAVLNAVAGEHSSFHQSHGRGILATTTGFDIDRAISQRGRQDREKRKRKGGSGGGSSHDNGRHEADDDVGRVEKTLSWADDDDDADGMTSTDMSPLRPYSERRRGARAQRDRVMNDNMSIMRMIQQLHPWHWTSGGGSRANAGDDDDGWTKPTRKGHYRQRQRRPRRDDADDDDDERRSKKSRMSGRHLRNKYDDMSDGDSDSDVEHLQELHRLQLQQHHQRQQQQQGGVFMWMVRVVVMLAYMTAMVLLLLCVIDLAWQMRLRWGGRRTRFSAGGEDAEAARKKKKKTSDLSASASQAQNNSSSNRDKSGKVGSSSVNKEASSRSRAKDGRDRGNMGGSSSRKHGHGKKQRRGGGGRGDADEPESGGGGLLGRVRKSASRVWGWGSWQ